MSGSTIFGRPSTSGGGHGGTSGSFMGGSFASSVPSQALSLLRLSKYIPVHTWAAVQRAVRTDIGLPMVSDRDIDLGEVALLLSTLNKDAMKQLLEETPFEEAVECLRLTEESLLPNDLTNPMEGAVMTVEEAARLSRLRSLFQAAVALEEVQASSNPDPAELGESVRRTVAVRTSGMPCTMEHWVAVLEREHQVTEEKRMRSLQKMEKHRERIENLEKAKEGLRKQLERERQQKLMRDAALADAAHRRPRSSLGSMTMMSSESTLRGMSAARSKRSSLAGSMSSVGSGACDTMPSVFTKEEEAVRNKQAHLEQVKSRTHDKLKLWDNRVRLAAIHKRAQALEADRQALTFKATCTRQNVLHAAIHEDHQRRRQRQHELVLERHRLDEIMLARRHLTPGPGSYSIRTEPVANGVVPFSASKRENVMDLGLRPVPGPGAYIDPTYRPSNVGVVIGTRSDFSLP